MKTATVVETVKYFQLICGRGWYFDPEDDGNQGDRETAIEAALGDVVILLNESILKGGYVAVLTKYGPKHMDCVHLYNGHWNEYTF